MAYEELQKLQAPLKRKRRRRILMIAAAIIAALGAEFAGWHIYLAVSLWGEAAALRKAGYPATLVELDAWYPTPPPGENAADVLAQAFAEYEYTVDDEDLPIVGSGGLPEPGQPLSAELKARLKNYLGRNAPAIILLRKGATMPKCRFPVDLTHFDRDSFGSHLGRLRQGARLMELEARLCVENHDAKGATESVIATFGLAKSLRAEPTLISHLTETALDSMAISTLQDVLARMNLDDDQLAPLANAVEAEEDNCQTGLPRGYIGETVLTLRLPARKIVGESSFRAAIRRTVGLSAEDRIVVARTARADAELAKRSLAEQLDVCRRLDQDAAKAGATLSARQMESTAMRWCIVNKAEAIARLRAAVTATAVERFRSAHGKLPATLTQLVPGYISAIPEDPFNGKPLRYSVRGESYTVYSVGYDLVDSGGAPRNAGGNFDITFSVDRQAAEQSLGQIPVDGVPPEISPSPAPGIVTEKQ